VGGLEDLDQRASAKAIRDELGAKSNIEMILSKIRLLERALGANKVNGLDGNGYSELGRGVCERIGRGFGSYTAL
jgi:hypothetical protein